MDVVEIRFVNSCLPLLITIKARKEKVDPNAREVFDFRMRSGAILSHISNSIARSKMT